MVDHELDELKREFLDEAREKVVDMEAALPEVPAREALDRLAYLAHQLKGSGGSYGYQKISTEAADLERAVESIVAQGSEEAAEPESLGQYVSNLRVEIDRAASELS